MSVVRHRDAAAAAACNNVRCTPMLQFACLNAIWMDQQDAMPYKVNINYTHARTLGTSQIDSE